MGVQMYTLYDKKSFLSCMKKVLPEGVIIMTTNVLDGAEIQKKKGSINIRQLHASEFFAQPDNLKPLMNGTASPISLLICKEDIISTEYLEKLKKGKGMTGFKIENPY